MLGWFRSVLLEILIPHPLLSAHLLKDENTKNSFETRESSEAAFLLQNRHRSITVYPDDDLCNLFYLSNVYIDIK